MDNNSDNKSNDNFKSKVENFESKTNKNFDEYYEKYLPKLTHYCKKFCKDNELALDYAQESFIVAIEKIDFYDSSKAVFSTWLYRIARNHVLQILKKEKRMPTVSMDIKVDEEGTTIKDFLEDDTEIKIERMELENLNDMKSKIILKCISKLKEPHRKVMRMREVKQMSYKDISISMGEDKKFKVSSDGVSRNKLPKEFLNIKSVLDSEGDEFKKFKIYNIKGKNKDLYNAISLPKGDYEVKVFIPLNLSTVKSQIRNSRIKLKEMVKKDFNILDSMY